MTTSVTDPFPRATRRDHLARVLDEFAGVAIRTAEPGTVDVPHDPGTLDALGVCAAEYTAAARDLAAVLGCEPLEASHLLDALAVAFTTIEVAE
ncbi:hypothetical protein [Tsukamurella hominis]|uniref:hypothetical protein n=1 Tax=Tsukamurella hominis TaxID=1970232 RepID=UPI0039E96A15